MGVRDNIHLITRVPDSVDCSSSSCPASSNSEESVPEGYLILTFDRAKRAKLKTAVFADVSNCQFTDDLDDDNFCDDEGDSTCDWPSNQPSLTSSDKSGDAAPLNEITGSVTSNVVTSSQSVPKKNAPSDCYGEVVWVDEANTPEQPFHCFTKTSCLKPKEYKPDQASESHCLIRTSPMVSSASTGPQIVRTIHVPQSLLSSSAPPSSPAVTVATSFNGTNTIHSRRLPLSVCLENKTSIKHSLSPWPQLRSNGFVRNRFISFPCSNAEEFESGNGRYPRRMLRCDACGKYYRNEYSLHHHICLKRKDVWKKGDVPSEVVDGQLIYFCPTCHKPFKWLGNLTRHFYVHTGQRFFKCDICSKEFFSAYQVKRHMNSHTGRRFKCEVCDKPFTCKYACAWHTRQHYSCVE